jgi:hypothetical protein
MLNEMEQDQEEDPSFIPELITEWNSKNGDCVNCGEAPCLVFPIEQKCRPLNSTKLVEWHLQIVNNQGVPPSKYFGSTACGRYKKRKKGTIARTSGPSA